MVWHAAIRRCRSGATACQKGNKKVIEHQKEVSISGMTCQHCVDAVTEELTSLAGVHHVSIDLVQGGVSTAVITSSLTLSDEEIGEAVAEAGYLVVANNA
jgi:copper chaperone